MDEMFAIKCQNCGGPMYSHQAKRSFECAYCGAVIPWQADAGEPKSALGIRPYAVDGWWMDCSSSRMCRNSSAGGPGRG